MDSQVNSLSDYIFYKTKKYTLENPKFCKLQNSPSHSYQWKSSVWLESPSRIFKAWGKNTHSGDLEKATAELPHFPLLGRLLWLLIVVERALSGSIKYLKKLQLDFCCFSGENDAIYSCFLYACSSILLTLCNKHVFSSSTFDFPWCSLAFQMLIAVLFVSVLGKFKVIDFEGFDKELLVRLFIPNLGFVGFLFSGSRSLRYVSIPMLSVLKSLAPVGIALFEAVYYREKLSLSMLISFFLMLIGNLIAGYNDISFSIWGYLWALVNIICNIIYVAMTRALMPREKKYSSWSKVYHNSVLSLFWMTLLAIFCGEWGAFGSSFLISFGMSGILGISISAASFYCIASTSGTTFSFVGSINKIPVVILGWLLFETKITIGSWIGVGIGLVASFLFTYTKTRVEAASRSHRKVASSSGAVTSSETFARVLSEEEKEYADLPTASSQTHN
eukprot:jgi/Galph1/3970/GphlegSOOS_G2588.1